MPAWAVDSPHQWNTHHELFSTRGACFDLDTVHHLTVPLGEHGLNEAVMTAATDPNSCEEPQEVAHASARLVNYELIWCNHDSQTVHENDFLGKIVVVPSRYSARGAFRSSYNFI